MKRPLIIALLFITSLTGTLSAQEPPTSERFRAARTRVHPILREQLTGRGLQWGQPIFIRIFKQEKELEVWLQDGRNFKLFKTYPICTYGFRSLGPKLRRGDGRAPEGFYYVTAGQMNPYSRYHLSFNLGYPNAYDRAHNRTGSALMVHGACVSIGCYAMTDPAIEEIYSLADAALRGGQPFFRVHIFPFRMSTANMQRQQKSKWIDFWRNLREGYNFFENNEHIPPNVEVRRGRYVFGNDAYRLGNVEL